MVCGDEPLSCLVDLHPQLLTNTRSSAKQLQPLSWRLGRGMKLIRLWVPDPGNRLRSLWTGGAAHHLRSQACTSPTRGFLSFQPFQRRFAELGRAADGAVCHLDMEVPQSTSKDPPPPSCAWRSGCLKHCHRTETLDRSSVRLEMPNSLHVMYPHRDVVAIQLKLGPGTSNGSAPEVLLPAQRTCQSIMLPTR